MPERPDNIFRFRRLKWGAPKRLDGLRAIGAKDAPVPATRSGRGGGIGLVLAGLVAAGAIVMSLLGLF